MSELRDLVSDVWEVTHLASVKRCADMTLWGFQYWTELRILRSWFLFYWIETSRLLHSTELAKEYLPLSKTWYLKWHPGFYMQIDNLLIQRPCPLSSLSSMPFVGSLRQMCKTSHWICSGSVVDKINLYADSILPHMYEEEKTIITSLLAPLKILPPWLKTIVFLKVIETDWEAQNSFCPLLQYVTSGFMYLK